MKVVNLKRKIIGIDEDYREKDYDSLRLEPLCIENPKLKNMLERMRWKIYKTPKIMYLLLGIILLIMLINISPNISGISAFLFLGFLMFYSYSTDLEKTIVKREESNDLNLYFLDDIEMKKSHNFCVGDIIEINIEVKKHGG